MSLKAYTKHAIILKVKNSLQDHTHLARFLDNFGRPGKNYQDLAKLVKNYEELAEYCIRIQDFG